MYSVLTDDVFPVLLYSQIVVEEKMKSPDIAVVDIRRLVDEEVDLKLLGIDPLKVQPCKKSGVVQVEVVFLIRVRVGQRSHIGGDDAYGPCLQC